MATNIVQMKDGSGNNQYPVTSAEAVGMPDGSGNLQSYLNKRVTELNISVLYPTQGIGGTNKYDLATAIAQVPQEYRTTIGLRISFINNETSKTENWTYNGGTFSSTSAWTTMPNQQQIIDLSNDIQSILYNSNIGSDGSIVTLNGRFVVLKYFKIDKQPVVTFEPSDITAALRYYNENKEFLGLSYTEDAKLVRIVGTTKISSVNENILRNYVLNVNNVAYELDKFLPIDGKYLSDILNTLQNDVTYVKDNSVLKTEMKSFTYLNVPKVIVGKGLIAGGAGSSISETTDPKRCYIPRIMEIQFDKISISINSNEYGINVNHFYLRFVDDAGKYVATVQGSTSSQEQDIPAGSTGFYINCIAQQELVEEEVLKLVVNISGVEYPFAGIEAQYVNPQKQIEKEIPLIVENRLNESIYYNNLLACFERIVTLGNSITAGYTGSAFVGTNISSNDARVTARNWPAYLKKLTGSDIINLGYGSTKTTDWRNSTPETEAQNLYCALELANIEGTQAYFNMLGWNDTIETGTSADIQIDYNDNALSFYGNYDYIVRRLHEFKPKAHIFVFTLARGKKSSPYNDAIRYIASLYPKYCHCIDYSFDPFFDTDFFSKTSDSVHYTPLSNNAFAIFLRNKVSEYIYQNPDKFKGIPYTADENLKGSIDVQGLVLSSANVEIQEIGQYTTLVANILPKTAANKNVTWSIISGDSECVNLIPNQSTIYCTIKGVKQGFALVQASSEEGGYKAVCMVSVAQEIVNVTSIKLSNSTLQIPLSEGEKTITATITPSSATNKNVRWSLQSGGDSVATIEATGLTCIITPRGAGNDIIIAVTEDGNKEARCTINVTA